MTRSVPMLLLAALAGVPAALAVPAPVALAQDGLPAAGLLEIVPVGDVVGDGATTATVPVIALNPDGTPRTRLALKPTASAGSVAGWIERAPGYYEFTYTPPKVTTPTEVTLDLQARGFVSKARLRVVPPAAPAILSASPAALVLGKDREAVLSIDLGPGGPSRVEDVVVSASAGSVQALAAQGAGRFTARFVAPGTNFPQLAVVTVADRRDPDGSHGALAIPLVGGVDFPVRATPGSAVTLQIAGRTFGPVTASAGGEARVPVEVPPGVPRALATTTLGGASQSAEIELGAPETRRIQLVSGPAAIPGDPMQPLTVRVAVLTPDGQPDSAARVRFESTLGDLSAPRHEGNGIYAATLTPRAVQAEATGTVQVSLEGSTVQATSAQLRVVPALPMPLPSSGFTAASTGNPPSRVLLVPAADSLPADGRSTVGVTVVALDAFGYPVPGVEVTLTADGDGKLPRAVTTGADGTAQAAYVAGTVGRLVRFSAAAGGASGVGGLVQGVASLPRPLPSAGDAEARSVRDAWSARLSGRAVAAATPVAPVGPPGAVASLTVGADPTTVQPGGTVALVIEARDAQGRGVGGQRLAVMSTAGVATAVTEMGNGLYQTSLAVPTTASGVVRVTAATEDGAVTSALTSVTVAGAPVGPVKPIAETTTPPPPVEPPPPEVPSAPWLRVSAAYALSSYAYEQRPFTENGPLLKQILAIGGENGAGNAIPQGFAARVRGVIPTLRYVGWDLGYRMGAYGIAAEPFGSYVVPDVLHTLDLAAVGRYEFVAGSGRFHVGARVGFQYNDFILFRGDITDTVEYEPLGLPGLGLAGELGAEFGPVAITAAFTEGFAYASVPYRTEIELGAAIAMGDLLFLDLGFLSQSRRLTVIGATSGDDLGELSDSQLLFKAGVGLAFR